MIRKSFRVEQYVSVTVDETKFTPEFMEEFREVFYPFQTITDHMEHLAQLYARGIVGDFTSFVEGYGDPKELGIEWSEGSISVEED